MPLANIFSKKKEEGPKCEVIIDNREKNSLLPSLLMEKGFRVRWEQLAVGDYLVNGVVVERKSVRDLKSSIVNKRIFSQLVELKQCEKYLLLVEGILDEDLYSRGIHENALRGFLLSAVLSQGVPVVFTLNEKDSAKYLAVLAKREKKSNFNLRAGKILMRDEERVQFILEGFPDIGAVKAKQLIERFGSLQAIVCASVEELEEILGKRAEEFRKLCIKNIK